MQSGLVYKGSAYVDAVGRWFHFFRSFGAGYTQRKLASERNSSYEPIPWLCSQKLEIKNDDAAVASLYTTENPTDVGAAPSPRNGDNLNFGPAAWTVALAALATGTYAVAAITAAQALGVLLDNGEEESHDTAVYEYPYEWQNGPCEAIHFARYELRSHENESRCDFHVRNVVTHCGHYGVENRYEVHVDPVASSTQIKPDLTVSGGERAARPIGNETTGNETNATANASRDNETANVTVPNIRPPPGAVEYTNFLEESDVASRISFSNIRDARLRELADGGPVYRARNPYIEVKKSASRAGSGIM